MTLVTNAFTSTDAIGNREDLTDYIYMISPMDTPFLSSIDKITADATLHEWQTDALDAAVDSNAQLEGDEIAPAASTPTVRLTNQAQIFYKAFAVTGTQEAVSKAGRRSELKHQILKNSKAIKRDIEASLLANKAKVARNNTTAGVMAGVLSWLATNTSLPGDGTAPTGDGTDTITLGTNRTFTETLFKDVLRQCFDEGGDPDTVMVGPNHKQTFSTFTGNATREIGAQDRELVATIDIYQSDFGTLQVVPNRFMSGFSGSDTSGIDHALVVQTNMFALATIRPPAMEDLSKIGDAERRFIRAECTLESRNEKASGIVGALS